MERFKEILASLPHDGKVRFMTALAEEVDKAHPEFLDGFAVSYNERERYRDYLTEEEARLVVDSFVNYDGTTGAKWSDPQLLFRRIEESGGKYEVEGEYNKWTSFVVMNMVYSDYGGVIRTLADGDRFFRTLWAMSVAILKDRDRDEAHTIRWYLDIDGKDLQ